jgi:DNA-binding FadR family transcriptional regulator
MMSTFVPARQRRLYQDVADQLREAVLAGRYRPGDRLPTEMELAGEFGVSRAVIRQATMNLEQQGLLEVQVGASGGTFVVEPGIEAVLHAFENLFRRGGVTVADYLSAKRVLEPVMTSAIAESITADQLDRLQENLQQSWDELRAGARDTRMLRISLDFHNLLAESTANPVLEVVMLAIVAMADRVPAFRAPTRTDWRQVLSEHDELLAALRARDTHRFSTVMYQHMDSIGGIYGDAPRNEK